MQSSRQYSNYIFREVVFNRNGSAWFFILLLVWTTSSKSWIPHSRSSHTHHWKYLLGCSNLILMKHSKLDNPIEVFFTLQMFELKLLEVVANVPTTTSWSWIQQRWLIIILLYVRCYTSTCSMLELQFPEYRFYLENLYILARNLLYLPTKC